jgi:hypothetical protein
MAICTCGRVEDLEHERPGPIAFGDDDSAALDEAEQLVERARNGDPEACPTCRSDDPAYRRTGVVIEPGVEPSFPEIYEVECRDSWHNGGRQR